MIDLRLITNGSRASVLLEGPDSVTLEALAQIQAFLRPPIFFWPHDGAPWASATEPGTVILHDVARLSLDDQKRLLTWLRGRRGATQVVTRSNEPLHPFVSERRFVEELYYCLNVVYIDCS